MDLSRRRLHEEPRARNQNPEPRTQKPEPRTQNPEPRTQPAVSGQFVNLRLSNFSFPPPGLPNPKNVTQLWWILVSQSASRYTSAATCFAFS